MRRTISFHLGNLILSISDAMDLASPSLIQHQQRTAFIVWKMGKAAKLSNERLERIFCSALLHDVGAFSLEEKINIRNYEVNDVNEHCLRGELILKNTPWLKETAKIIRYHHKEWKSWDEQIDSYFVFESQLLFLADYVERSVKREKYILHQNEDIIASVRSLSGSSFHPDVADLFLSVSQSEDFWLDMASPKLYFNLIKKNPFRKIEVDFDDVLKISELFRNIIDFRSRFTSTHSSGVAASASMLSRIFGLTEKEIKLMEVAGNLHDVGKLVIPNSILDKPGKLTRSEISIMKSHTYYSYSLISTIGGLDNVAEWAAYHHERLDGSGYPFRYMADELSTGARIVMVADMFTALAEDRPYRKGLSRDEITKIIKQFSDRNLLDKRIVSLLFENHDEIYKYVTEKQHNTRDFYEKQFSENRLRKMLN